MATVHVQDVKRSVETTWKLPPFIVGTLHVKTLKALIACTLIREMLDLIQPAIDFNLGSIMH